MDFYLDDSLHLTSVLLGLTGKRGGEEMKEVCIEDQQFLDPLFCFRCAFFQPGSERLLKGDRMQDSIHFTALANTAKVEGFHFLFKTQDHF